ncbi:MAG: hypothetical protein V3V03_06725 [Hyphomonadaceae bacterium]
MQSKRRRLRLSNSLVNAGLATLLLFGIGACSKQEAEVETEITEASSVTLTGTVELPAVWSTEALKGPVADVALAGGYAPLMAVAFEGAGLQLFTLKAERLAEPGPYSVKHLADGQHATIDGLDVTLFPGIDRDGVLKAYVYGEGLVAPIAIDLPIEPSSRAAGLCSAPAIDDSDGLFLLAYWTELSPTILYSGRIVEVNTELVWLPAEPVEAGTDAIKACMLIDGGAKTTGGAAITTTALTRPDFEALITLDGTGGLSMMHETLGNHPIKLLDGITVTAPETPVAIAALGVPRDGGYPGGLIVVAGETAPDEHKIVFVDTGVLTLLGSD